MAKYNLDESSKGIVRLKLILSLVLNAIIFVPVIVYRIVDFQTMIFLMIGLNIILSLVVFIKPRMKSFIINETQLVVQNGSIARTYELKEVRNLRFYFNSFTNYDTGQRTKGFNVCEISMNDGGVIEIIENEMDDFNAFKLELVEKIKT